MAEQTHSTLQPLSPPASDAQKDASWKEWHDKNPKSTAPSADHGPTGATEKNLDTTSSAEEKMESLWAFVDKTGVGVLTTLSKDGGMLGRAMGNLKIEKEGRGAVWFATNRHSSKIQHLTANSHASLSYIDTSKEWASIAGACQIVDDREKIKELYSSSLRMWMGDLEDGVHDGGPEDPRIVLLRLTPTEATCSLQSTSTPATMLKMAKSYVTGDPPKIHMLRHVSRREMAMLGGMGLGSEHVG